MAEYGFYRLVYFIFLPVNKRNFENKKKKEGGN